MFFSDLGRHREKRDEISGCDEEKSTEQKDSDEKKGDHEGGRWEEAAGGRVHDEVFLVQEQNRVRSSLKDAPAAAPLRAPRHHLEEHERNKEVGVRDAGKHGEPGSCWKSMKETRKLV